MTEKAQKIPKDISKYSHFGIPATASAVIEIDSRRDIERIISVGENKGLDIHVLGEGFNTLFADTHIDKLLVKNNLHGITINENDSSVILDVAAGENWDELVAFTVEKGWAGIEALSAIPGSVGAAPVQNIGAYGAELADVFMSCEVFDLKTKKTQTLQKKDCKFAYRSSIFKAKSGRFTILSVKIKLQKQAPQMPDYQSVKDYFSEHEIEKPNLAQIRSAITKIRWQKLPKPEQVPNLGSFFENPVVAKRHAAKLAEKYTNMPRYDTRNGVKIPAGWLIEEAGLKGIEEGSVGVYEDNALVLTSHSKASATDLITLISKIKQSVQSKFDIRLQREPDLLI